VKARGGAVVELVLWTGVVGVMLAASFQVAQLVLWRMRLASAAQLAATLTGTGRLPPSDVEREVRAYVRQWPNADRATLTFSSGRFLGVPSAPFYNLMSITLRLRLPSATLEETVRVQQEGVS
jgi:hypothetical protein